MKYFINFALYELSTFYCIFYLDISQENDMLLPMIDSAKNDAAIKSALDQQWQEAVALNEQILKSEPDYIDALNRLGYALLKLGKPIKAKQIFQKVLKLDQYNRIALNNSKKLSASKGQKHDPCTHSVSPMLFLEDPGKTKIVECVNTASSTILTALTCGQDVFFKLKKHGIDVRDGSGSYIGALPDDVSYKLIKFISEGNTYSAHIRHVSKSAVTLFVRELSRGKKFLHQPSFATSVSYNPSVREDTSQDTRPDILENNEEEQQ